MEFGKPARFGVAGFLKAEEILPFFSSLKHKNSAGKYRQTRNF